MAYVGNEDHESARRVFDLIFSDGFPTENNFLLLIKVCLSVCSTFVPIRFHFTQAITLFLCGKHDDAVLRVDNLINIADDKSLYLTVRVCARQGHSQAELIRRCAGSNATFTLVKRRREQANNGIASTCSRGHSISRKSSLGSNLACKLSFLSGSSRNTITVFERSLDGTLTDSTPPFGHVFRNISSRTKVTAMRQWIQRTRKKQFYNILLHCP